MSKVTNIKALIEAHRGQFFSVDFIKADGTLRTYKNAQKCHKAGHTGKNPVEHKPHLLTIVENFGGEYQHRTLNLENVVRLKISGVEYNFQ